MTSFADGVVGFATVGLKIFIAAITGGVTVGAIWVISRLIIALGGFVTGTLIDSQRHARTVLAHAAVATLQVSNAPLLRMRSVLRDVRWRWVLKVLWTAA